MSLNGLSFCITNLDRNEVIQSQQIQYYQPIALSHLPEELLNFLDKHQVMNHNYQQVLVVHNNPWFSLVPSSLYDPNCLGDYLKYNAALLADDNPAIDYLVDLDIHSVYIPFTHVNNALLDRFSTFDFIHHSSALLKKLYPVQKQLNSDKAYAYIEGHSMSLSIFKDKKLALFNVFEIQNPDELLYYLLFSFEQLALDPEIINLDLFGVINVNDANHKRICEFVKNVHFYIPELPYQFNSSINVDQIELISLIAQ